jgi:diguanylate cyclase (GGDEF)-like protein
MTLGFRNRLALFLLATLALVQVLTIGAVYTSTRHALITQSRRELAQDLTVLERDLDLIADRLAESARILSLDYALRSAIAERDTGTALSALNNFGRRIGATRLILIDLDGTVAADTAPPLGGGQGRQRFAFPALLDPDAGNRATLAVMDGGAYRLVVVPVLAPVTVAWIAIAVRIDSTLADELRALSTVPKSLGLVAQATGGTWFLAGSSGDFMDPAARLPRAMDGPAAAPTLMQIGHGEYVELTAPLRTAPGSAPILAVLQFSLDDALQAYRPLMISLLAILLVGLAAALGFTSLIARTVTRPVAALAAIARRIESGDYEGVAAMGRPPDEFGHLAAAMGEMAKAIGEREERIRFQATHDPLTGLPNRVSLEADLERVLVEAAAEGVPVSVMLVEFARIAEINVTLGHELGDRLIRDGANRLADLMFGQPVARMWDTAFAVVLKGVDAATAWHMAQDVAVHFEMPYIDGELRIDADVALGLAVFPQHAEVAHQLLQRADTALYAARRTAGRVVFYDPDRDPHRPEQLSLMGDLRDAIEGEGLILHYQPKVDVATRRVVGAEALVRWHHPKRGFMSPDLFVPLAEETGTVQRLTRWVLRTAIAQAASWDRAGLPIYVAVNLSVHDLNEADLPDYIADLLEAAELPKDRLVLEITESAVMLEPETALAILRRLQAMGLSLALDDFGVGQSSLAYLRRLPVQEIKIDKSFVLKLADSPEDQAIVRSIIDLGRNLGHHITAEGVEDGNSLDLLEGMGCDGAQGYFVSRPLPTDAFVAFVRAWPAGPGLVEAVW